MSDRPSRIHDPSDIRDKTLTSLLTNMVKGRTDHDELTSGMKAQRFPRGTISMIRDQNGASSAVSGETESGHRTVGCEESETAAAHWPLDRNQCLTVTDVTPDGSMDAQLEDTCRRGICRGLERERQRWHVLDRCRSEGPDKTKTSGNVSPGESQSDNKSLRRPYPRKPVLRRESLGRSCDEWNSSSPSQIKKSWCSSRTTRSTRQSCST